MRLSWFTILYGGTSLLAGIGNVISYLQMQFNILQVLTLAFVSWASIGFEEVEMGFDVTGDAARHLFCFVAPFVLIASAAIRGRQLGLRRFVVYPLVSMLIVLLGIVPFFFLGALSIAVPTLLGWACDAKCLMKEQKVLAAGSPASERA